MKGFICWDGGRLGSYYMPVYRIIKIGCVLYPVFKNDIRIEKWQVRIEIDASNPEQRDRYWTFETEAEAREFYDYCLKQVAEWQDKGGENG